MLFLAQNAPFSRVHKRICSASAGKLLRFLPFFHRLVSTLHARGANQPTNNRPLLPLHRAPRIMQQTRVAMPEHVFFPDYSCHHTRHHHAYVDDECDDTFGRGSLVAILGRPLFFAVY